MPGRAQVLAICPQVPSTSTQSESLHHHLAEKPPVLFWTLLRRLCKTPERFPWLLRLASTPCQPQWGEVGTSFPSFRRGDRGAERAGLCLGSHDQPGGEGTFTPDCRFRFMLLTLIQPPCVGPRHCSEAETFAFQTTE